MDGEHSLSFFQAPSIAAYFAYAFMMLFFARKYIWRTIRAAIGDGWKAPAAEIMSYRTAYLLLLGAFAGMAAWAHWLGASMAGMTLFFAYVLTLAFVSARSPAASAERPYSHFTPYEGAHIIPLLGGIVLSSPSAW